MFSRKFLLGALFSLAVGAIIGAGAPPFIAGALPWSLPGGPKTGRFYTSALGSAGTGAAVSAANRLWASPVFVGATATLKTLAFDISSGNASAYNVRMCVFADTGAGLPGALVADSGTVAVGSGSQTGIKTGTIANGGAVIPGPGWYWVGLMVDTTGESLFAINGNGQYLINDLTVGFNSATNLFTTGGSNGYYMAQTFSNGCPSSFSGSPTDANGQVVPMVAMGY